MSMFGGGGGFLTNNNSGFGGGYNGGNNYGRNNNNYADDNQASASKAGTSPLKGDQSKKKGTIIPLTIKKLLDASKGMDDVVEVDKYPIDQAVIVGRVYKLEEQSTRVVLHMDDTTGRIQVAYYKKTDAHVNSSLDKLEYKENMYVKAVVVVRPFKTQKMYVSNMLQEVIDYNQISYHFLSTFMASAYRLKGPLPNRPEPDSIHKNLSTQQNNAQSNGGMGMNIRQSGNKDPRSMVKDMIIQIQNNTNNGVCKQSQLMSNLRTKLDEYVINECLMRLETDGEICQHSNYNGEAEYVTLGS